MQALQKQIIRHMPHTGVPWVHLRWKLLVLSKKHFFPLRCCVVSIYNPVGSFLCTDRWSIQWHIPAIGFLFKTFVNCHICNDECFFIVWQSWMADKIYAELIAVNRMQTMRLNRHNSSRASCSIKSVSVNSSQALQTFALHLACVVIRHNESGD